MGYLILFVIDFSAFIRADTVNLFAVLLIFYAAKPRPIPVPLANLIANTTLIFPYGRCGF